MDLILSKKPLSVKENPLERESKPDKDCCTLRAKPKVETAHHIGSNHGTEADAGIELVVLEDALANIAEHLADIQKGRKLPLYSDIEEYHF